MLLSCNCQIYYSPFLSFVQLTVSSWLTITCSSICNWKSQTSTWSFPTFGGGSQFDLPPIPHPTVNQVVFSDICHFVRSIPVHVVRGASSCSSPAGTRWAAYPRLAPFSLVHELLFFFFFGQWLWCSPWPPSFHYLKSFLSISLGMPASRLTKKLILNTFFLNNGHIMQGNTLALTAFSSLRFFWSELTHWLCKRVTFFLKIICRNYLL